MWLAAALCLALNAPVWLNALLVLPALLWAPGWGWARWLAARKQRPVGLQATIDATWISFLVAVISVSLVRELGLPPWTLLPLAALLGLPGLWLAHRRPAPGWQLPAKAGVGLLATLLAVMALGAFKAQDLLRPLDASWWDARADEQGLDPLPLEAAGFEPVGWPEAGAAKAALGTGSTAIRALGEGRLLAVARGPARLELSLEQDGGLLDRGVVQLDPVEVPEEGPVPRYLSHGAVAVAAHVRAGALQLNLSQDALVYLLPGSEAVWSLHHAKELRFVHYYQLLNMVENQRWAAGMLRDQRATLNQPPLWAYVLALPTALVDPDMAGAGALFLWVLLLTGASGVRLLQVMAPQARWPAWFLPALATVVHGRLMADPGSFNFPDSLYAAAVVGGMAALLAGGGLRHGAMAVAASLLRYPGAVLLLGAALLQRLLEAGPRRFAGSLWRPLGLAAALAAAVALAATVIAAATGALGQWMEILWFETFPEHWHGEYSPALLLPRAPRFYATWLSYAGLTPLLAVVVARGRPLLVLLTAFCYSLLLCTIDHHPTHYFLPLVHLAAIALAAGAGNLKSDWGGRILLGLGLVGLAWSAFLGGT